MTSAPCPDLPREHPDVFARVRVILVRPSHPGNVGSTARAIKTMGFEDLHLVDPPDPDVLRNPQAQALASGADDTLRQARLHPTLQAALGPVTLAFGLTARPRALGPAPCDMREAAGRAAEHLARPDTRVALVLGTERSGLSNADLGLCHAACHIPANPAYSSLNVAQAAQLAAWELRYALLAHFGGARLPDTRGRHDPGADPASSAQVQALLDHTARALEAIGFLDPAHPKKLMPRLRQMWIRNQLTHDEVDLLRGLCTAMIRTAGRAHGTAIPPSPTRPDDARETRRDAPAAERLIPD